MRITHDWDDVFAAWLLIPTWVDKKTNKKQLISRQPRSCWYNMPECVAHVRASSVFPIFLDAVIPSTCSWPLGGESETTPALQRPLCEICENTMYRTHTHQSCVFTMRTWVSVNTHVRSRSQDRSVSCKASALVHCHPESMHGPDCFISVSDHSQKSVKDLVSVKMNLASNRKSCFERVKETACLGTAWTTTLVGDWTRMMRMCRSPGTARYVT